MEKIEKKINGVDFTFIKTKKFKSVGGAIYFKLPVSKYKLTSYGMLRRVLLQSTKKYNTNEKLEINCKENYGAYYEAGLSRIGKYLVMHFSFESLNDKYTANKNLKKVIDTFLEIVFNPNIFSDSFEKKSFDLCYKKFMLSLDKVKESQDTYSQKRILTYLNQDKPYSYDQTKETLKKITNKTLYQDYLEMISQSEVSVIIAGEIDEDEEMFYDIADKIKSTNTYKEDLYINNDDENDDYKEIEETSSGKENILRMIAYIKGVNHYEINYVIPIYNYIFGGCESSRIFSSVREKNSLAYYCYSRLLKDDGLIEIVSGVEKDNYKKTIDLIKKELKNMCKITNKELKAAKKELSSILIESQDYVANLVSRQEHEKLYGLPEIHEYIKKLNEVTKEEVESINKKVELKLSYFLKGRD